MDPLLFVMFWVLFLLSAFFSGTEIALMSIPNHKLESLLKQGKVWSKSLKKIKENNDRLLITILIWNNLANVYTAALATSMAISMAESSGFPSAYTIGISTWIVTFALLVFGEIVPKSFATKNASLIAVSVAPIYKFLMVVFYPIIVLMELIIKLFSGKNTVEKMTEEEIESFIDMGMHSWSLDKWDYEKIKNILDFSDTTAEEIMVPRVKIDTLSSNTTVKEALEYYVKHTHSRIPIYTDTIDKIERFMTIRDILGENPNKKLSELELSKVLKIPSNKPISKLLTTFQKSTKHMAILIDEYGGVAGLITLEDVIEEILWDIRDETDNEDDEMSEIGKDTIIAESYVGIEDVLDKFSLDFIHIWLDEKEFWGETLSALITHTLERFPSNGEVIDFEIFDLDEEEVCGKLYVKVIDIQNSRIGKVEIRKENKKK